MRCPATSPGGSGFVFRVCLRGLGAVSERPLSDSRRGLARLSVNAARCEAVIEGVDRATAERRAFSAWAIWQQAVLRQTGLRQYSHHRLVVHAQLPSNGTDAPLLDMVIA